MQSVVKNDDNSSLRERKIPEFIIYQCYAVTDPRRGIQPHTLFDHGVQFIACHAFNNGQVIGHRSKFLQFIMMICQQVKRPCQRVCCCFESGNEQNQDLVDDLIHMHRVTVVFVARV